ncbi:MAG: DUF4430 domain-containing protein [Thermoplasmata archaeon]|nr:MAG: DUF4430 domain-containing protein [Thermoplasmata archaeon]
MAKGGPTGGLAVLAVVAVLLVSGCLTTSNGDDDVPAKDITLIIDFEGFDPDTFPDQRVEWTKGDGAQHTIDREDRVEGALYIVNDLEATDALDVLAAAEEATGVSAVFHIEAQGAFVDSIDGIVNGRDGHYWSYYVDGEYGLVSADSADLENGDLVRWVYMGNPFG